MAILEFQDIYDAALERTGQSTSDTALVGYLKDWINFRYKEICSMARWPWLQDNQTIRMLAEYTTGTVACTTLTTTITGTSTVWTKAMTDRKFKFNSFEEIYRIAQWASATGIVLADTYNGDTVTADTYSIFQDEYLCPFDWADIISIMDLRNGRKLEKKQLREIRAENPSPYPNDSDPTAFAFFETRDITRIDVDNISGTFQVDERIDGGSSNAYGNIKEVGSDYLYVQVLYGTFTNDEEITGATSSATADINETSGYTEGNVGHSLKIVFDPPPYRNILYNCEVIKKPVELSGVWDEPLIPEEFRDILFYFAVADILDFRKQPENRDRWEAKAQSRIMQMKTKYRHQMGNPRIRSAYPRVNYV